MAFVPSSLHVGALAFEPSRLCAEVFADPEECVLPFSIIILGYASTLNAHFPANSFELCLDPKCLPSSSKHYCVLLLPRNPSQYSAPPLTRALTAVWLSGHRGLADCHQGAAHQLLQGKQQGDGRVVHHWCDVVHN